MLKKFSAMILALVMTVSLVTSCSEGDSSSSNGSTSSSSAAADSADSSTESAVETVEASLTIDGESIDTDNLIMCTIDGIDVDFETFRYYYFYTLNLYENTYGVTMDIISETDGAFDLLMSDVITQLKQEYVTLHLCEENDIELTDEDYEQIEETIETAKSNYDTDEEYVQALESSYLTEDLYRRMVELSTLYQKVEDTLFTNGGKYATTEDEFREIVQDPEQYARVLQILIPYQCQVEITDEDTLDSYDDMTLSEKYSAKETAYNALSEEEQEAARDEAHALAEEVAEMAQNGDDFESLIAEYGWDPGMENNSQGYYMSHDTNFVQEFIDAGFELEENEVSGPVESSTYGWFILKRLPVDMDYVEENIDSMIIEYDTPTISQLYSDIMDEMEVSYGEYYDQITPESIT